MSKEHRIVQDCAGAGYPRATCEWCQQQVVRQPYLTDIEWGNMLRNFEARHGSGPTTGPGSLESGPLKRWPE